MKIKALTLNQIEYLKSHNLIKNFEKTKLLFESDFNQSLFKCRVVRT